jgi:hypothetical protein
VQAIGDIGLVTIGGNLTGGDAEFSGSLFAFGKMAGVKVGGSLLGGTGNQSGLIFSFGEIGNVSIGGDLVGGSASGTAALSESGFIRAKRIANLTIGGSLIAGTNNTTGTYFNNGAVRVADDLGTVLIKGSIIGSVTNPVKITARGKLAPTATSDLAIGRLTVLGRVEFGLIVTGIAPDGAVLNADAQIGAVSVGGDWIASSLAAGAVGVNGFFGDNDDLKIAGVKDVATISSKITSLTIGGQVMGNLLSGTDHFGIVAEQVGVIKIGGTLIPTTLGINNDDFFLGGSGDFKVHEISSEV